jgi:NAD(P)-dependent dehydrogenase (short-subunit alcohol dehydrogenase family)
MMLKGKVALVTGSAVRLGKALALALAGKGARLVIHYGSSASPAKETASQIETLGCDVLLLQADLSRKDQGTQMIENTVAHFGQLDILINSAAIFKEGDWDNTTESDWDAHFSINLKAPFFLSQAFASQLGKGKQGHIINIIDWRATHPDAHHIAYTLTKSALLTMTLSLSQALAPHIQVNAIAPGAILPPPGKDQSYLDNLAQKVPLKRAGSPQDVAQAMLFLLESKFITGEVIYVTGGEHL